MAQLIQFEGQTHELPGDLAPADIQRALSHIPRGQSAAIPPLPPGYTLDNPQHRPALPVLPPGFTLDKRSTLVPVEGHPFAAAPQAAVKLVPVEGDPFANAPVPNIQPPIGPVPAGSPERLRVTPLQPERPDRPLSILPSSVGGAARDLQVGSQAVGKGLADIVTFPFDMAAGAQNLITSGLNRIPGIEHITRPLFGSDTIPYATPASKLLEKAVDASGIPTVAPEDMGRGQKLLYDMERFGTQAITGGAALAQRAPQVAAQTVPSATFTGRVADAFARPYVENPTRAHIGDAIGGMGAGVGVNAADNIPEHPAGGDWIKKVANVLAPITGAIGATTVQSAAEGLGGLVRNLASRAFTSAPREIPLNPVTKAPYTSADVERAATRLQAAATGAPRALAQDIRENASELTSPSKPGASPLNASALPTSGLLSRDPGLLALEQGDRLRKPADFIQRDQNVKSAAGERVEGARDPDADLSAVFRRASEARNEQLAPAEDAILQRDEASRALEDIRRDQGASLAVNANSDARANASRRLDRALVDESYVPARAEKNRLFDTAPGRHDELPADAIFAAADRVRRGANGLAPGTLPEEFLQRLEALRPNIVEHPPESGNMVNVGGLGTASGADLADLRKYLNTAQMRAQQSGNFDLADNIGTLRAAINRTIEAAPGYAKANQNYQQFAQRFRPEPNDEMAKFTRELDRSGNTEGLPNRGSTPPSATADRFLASPEKAATLSRALDGSPAAARGYPALREYLRSSFAMSALNPDGTLNPIRASAWAGSHADILAQFPGVRAEFDAIVAQARRGEQLSAQARADLETARAARNATEADIDRSAIGTLLREDPRDVASKLLGDGYASEAKLDEINALVRNDTQASRGWKAAVAEVLADKVQKSRLVGETPEVQFARLAKEFKDNEALLSKTFSPEEMNNLRQAHTLLGYFKEAEKRATVGSDTAEKWNIPGWAQLAVRHFKGDLAGGGLIKRFKLLIEQLPSNKQSADEIVHMAWFNPDVAAYLLERPVKNPNVSQYNVNLRRLIAAANGARNSGGGNDQQ